MRRLAFSAIAVLSLTISGLTQTHRPAPARPTPKAKAPELPAVPLPAEPGLYAVIYTSMGNIVCRLFEKQAPKTVANFRGLATGTKAWTDPTTGRLRHTPLYSGTTFHRVIPGFMIQGGDPTSTGTGSPGYTFADEIDPSVKFDRPGILAMANSGPNTNGCQFFITVGPAEHLNGNYSVFGELVSGQEIAEAISKVPRDSADKPNDPVKITAIGIRTVKTPVAGAGEKSPNKPIL